MSFMRKQSRFPINHKDAEFLKRVTRNYLKSGNFNGYYVSYDICPSGLVRTIKKLVAIRKIDIVFCRDQAGAHIKAFPPKNVYTQLEILSGDDWSGFAYPTPNHLKTCINPSKYEGRPYSLELALGLPQMTPRVFRADILDVYRNNRKYRVWKGGERGYIYEVSDNFSPVEILCMFTCMGKKDMCNHIYVFAMYLHRMPPFHQRLWKSMEEASHITVHPSLPEMHL